MGELERRHAVRESEAMELVESTKRVALVEAERARRQMAAVLDAKNAEVRQATSLHPLPFLLSPLSSLTASSPLSHTHSLQVDGFRTELDAIVLDIKLMHAKQAEAAALNARKPRPRDLA